MNQPFVSSFYSGNHVVGTNPTQGTWKDHVFTDMNGFTWVIPDDIRKEFWNELGTDGCPCDDTGIWQLIPASEK
jgi:hypothetical protein